ncbi:MAG: type II toxin-antitoxin system PemK/MazF family toxin [Timaviella obliquedivisa GSE-PSE-MK23-08B]|jgi:mRNA interferase MazF|nr:type II toxin-antitoxin system PemK/MazF family toxin [Timaviella obliquedivisa GSE-PSE-MK23-08B]
MSLIPRQYEIYLAELNPIVDAGIGKIRPVVIVSQNAMNRYLETIVICPLTFKLHPQWQSRLQIICAGKPAEIVVDQIRTISKSRLRKKLDNLSVDSADQLRRLITEMYGES